MGLTSILETVYDVPTLYAHAFGKIKLQEKREKHVQTESVRKAFKELEQ